MFLPLSGLFLWIDIIIRLKIAIYERQYREQFMFRQIMDYCMLSML